MFSGTYVARAEVDANHHPIGEHLLEHGSVHPAGEEVREGLAKEVVELLAGEAVRLVRVEMQDRALERDEASDHGALVGLLGEEAAHIAALGGRPQVDQGQELLEGREAA